jgi:hypothetical protein
MAAQGERAEIEHSSTCTTCYRRDTTRITYAEPRASGVRYRCRGWLMASRHAPIDHAERDLASVQLDALALAHDGLPWAAWKDAVLHWHLQRLATARAEAWVPGFAGCHDNNPVIAKLLSRFYRHHMHIAIRRLRAENIELRRKIVEAAECTRFYARGAIDAGERANTVLRSLFISAVQ